MSFASGPIKILFAILLAVGCNAPVHAAVTPPTNQQKAKAARDAMLAQVPDVAGLPRVLLLGDSISMAYTPKVRAALAGKANVHRPPENCFDSANGVKKLETWLGTGKWDVIHFNFGLHDNNHFDENKKMVPTSQGKLVATPEQYGKNLREIVTRLKRTGAILIFATTTPIPPDAVGRVPGAEVTYNAVAVKIMREAGVQINDLHAFLETTPQPRPSPGNVHFTDAGNEALARLVTQKIEAALLKRK
jgi:hypothetical protein